MLIDQEIMDQLRDLVGQVHGICAANDIPFHAVLAFPAVNPDGELDLCTVASTFVDNRDDTERDNEILQEAHDKVGFFVTITEAFRHIDVVQAREIAKDAVITAKKATADAQAIAGH